MLFGRDLESAQIDEVLDAARERRSGALVLRGEAGIGKTALLDAAVDRATDTRVLRALGVESEVEIAFSGLHELLRPAFPLLDAVPDAQAVALRAALALGADETGERLAVFGGVLSLLATAAEEQPVLCVIDDAHWLDDASAAALTFVARRLDRDGVAMLFSVREPELRSFPATGIQELRLSGLDRGAAAELLASRMPAGTSSLVVEQIIELSQGSPLALIELPRGLEQTELAREEPLQEPFRLAASVEREFVRRLAGLPVSTRRALLVAATSDAGDLRVLSRALEALELDPSSLEPAEGAGLVTIASAVEFCHPLARSAIYGAAGENERREAHLALADGADAAGETGRRAWHLAAAARAPDEEIASALVAAAESARRRGSVWAEARALERAARLTPEPRARARRLARAGDAARRAGRHERARALLEEAVAGDLGAQERAQAQARRAFISFEQGAYEEGLALMIDGANELEAADPGAAAILLTNAATIVQHRLDLPQAFSLAERAWRLGLAYTLHMYAQLEWYSGNLQRAYAHALEAAAVVEEMGTPQGIDECACRLATFEAMLGREEDSRRHAQSALDSALRLGDTWNAAKARNALGLLALLTGDASGAAEQLAAGVAALEDGGVGNPNHFRAHPDLVEAYVRLGRTDEAEPVVAALERRAEATRIPWTVAAARRCRAVITEDEDAAREAFEDALQLDDGSASANIFAATDVAATHESILAPLSRRSKRVGRGPGPNGRARS